MNMTKLANKLNCLDTEVVGELPEVIPLNTDALAHCWVFQTNESMLNVQNRTNKHIIFPLEFTIVTFHRICIWL